MAAPNNVQDMLKIAADGTETEITPNQALQNGLTSLANAQLDEPVAMVALITTTGDTYLIPVTPTQGQADKPDDATQEPGGLTITRWKVNPNYCYVDMGGWGFYYEC
jgi:hypothetical protein